MWAVVAATSLRSHLIDREPVLQYLNPQLAKLTQGQLVILRVLFVRVAVADQGIAKAASIEGSSFDEVSKRVYSLVVCILPNSR